MFKASLDEEAQIIIQDIEGPLDETGFLRLTQEIDECVARLKNPEDIRMLVDGRQLVKINARTRQLSLETFREQNVKRMAVWGCNPLIRAMIRIMSVAEGRGRIKAFATEAEARTWLAANRKNVLP